MAKITTRAGLNVGTELTIDETLRTFTLNVAGNLVAKDGVTTIWSSRSTRDLDTAAPGLL